MRPIRQIIPIGGALVLTAGLPAMETEQVLKGEVLIEGINQNNYTDGDNDKGDRLSQMWIRAGLGLDIEFDDRAEVSIGMVYQGEGGDEGDAREELVEEVHLQEAYLLLKQFIRPNIHLRIGRQPVSWNLRKDYGAFLYDSRADDPTVDRWDGVRGYWQFDNFEISPFGYLIDEATDEGLSNASDVGVFGIAGDWRPDRAGDDRVFLTGSISLATKVPVRDRLVADQLYTYYGGAEWALAYGIDLYGEFAFQDGESDGDLDFRGYGWSLGMQWKIPGEYDPAFTLQYDHFSGDKQSDDEDFDGFVAPYEAVGDTLIVEHERYGELSEYLVGNLQAIKLTAEYAFFEELFTTKLTSAYYQLAEEVDGDSEFGTEVDLSLAWQYNDYTRLGAFAGVFLPDAAFEAVAPAPETDDDEILLLGLNGHVTF